MGILKVGFLAAVALFAGVGIFLGCVMLLTSLQNGAISISYSSGGKGITETITRAGDNARFWQLMLTMGLAPIGIGAVALWYSVRKLRS